VVNRLSRRKLGNGVVGRLGHREAGVDVERIDRRADADPARRRNCDVGKNALQSAAFRRIRGRSRLGPMMTEASPIASICPASSIPKTALSPSRRIRGVVNELLRGARGRIETAGADDDRACPRVRHWRTVEIMALHDARGLQSRGEGRISKAERPDAPRLEKIRVRLMLRRRSGQRGGQQIKAEVGIRNRLPWGERERIGLEPCRERLGCDVDEWIVRRPRLLGDFARQSGRVGGEIDEPDRPSALRHRHGELRAIFGQRIGKADHAVRRHARQNLAGELGDGPDKEQRIGARRLVCIVGATAEALDRRLPIATDAEDGRGRLDRQEQELGGEADRLVEQGLARKPASRPLQSCGGKGGR
jgi:hypothetical protein